MARVSRAAVIVWCLALLAHPETALMQGAIEPERVAARIAAALDPAPNEIVVIRADDRTQAIARAAAAALARAGADVRTVSSATTIAAASEAHRGARAFVSLAVSPDVADAERIELPAILQAREARHLDLDWRDGTRRADGLPAGEDAGSLTAAYAAALDEQPADLRVRLSRAEALLRSRGLHITTPHGTSLRFSVGDRPFVREDGDASPKKVAAVPAGRVVHLPAGALRVAPVETSITGRLELPEAQFGALRATKLRLFFVRGRALELQCCSDRQPPLDSATAAPLGAFAGRYFQGVPLGELMLGFNTRLPRPRGAGAVPFHGFGAGMVRLCVGDNEALGGLVRGVDSGPIRCFYLPDATVEAGGKVLVRDGALSPDLLRAGA